jgi:hypothetical protein
MESGYQTLLVGCMHDKRGVKCHGDTESAETANAYGQCVPPMRSQTATSPSDTSIAFGGNAAAEVSRS